MARESLIRLRQSDVPGKIPELEQLELGELVTNTYEGRLYAKQVTEDFERLITFVGKVPIQNTIFVQKNGEDRNSGDSWDSAVLTIEKAVELATERDRALTLIDVGPGVYMTKGHIDLPDNTLIRAAHRSVIIRPEPGFEEQNVFRMGSGCFIEGPVFEGWRLDNLEDPTEGFAVCFRPGAMITRVPYVHKIVVRSTRTWDTVAPPLDRKAANPLVGRGGGVVLADGSVLSPYSIYPNIMTWGATPVSHNGIGYCAKNGGLINAVNAVSLWAHKHFYAINGGQIILSSCSTQFGDYTMVAKGTRKIVNPREIDNTSVLDYTKPKNISILSPTTSTQPLSVQTAAASTVMASSEAIIDNMWSALVGGGYTTVWTSADETFTRRDAGLFLAALANTLKTADESYMLDFARSLFLLDGTKVFASDKLSAFVFSFENMRDQINTLVNDNSQTIVTALVAALNTTIQTPTIIKVSLSQQTAAASAILSEKANIIDAMWTKLTTNGYTVGWTSADETFTRRDAGLFINALAESLKNSSQQYVNDFARNLFYATGEPVFASDKLFAFIASFDYMRGYINNLSINSAAKQIVEGLSKLVTSTLYYPDFDQNISILSPTTSTQPLSVQTAAASTVMASSEAIIDNMWSALVGGGYTTVWTSADETFTRRDAGLFLAALANTLKTADESYMLDFARSLFLLDGTKVFASDKLSAFVFSFENMRDQINTLVNDNSQTIVTALVAALNTTIQTPTIIKVSLSQQTAAASAILSEKANIIDAMWTKLTTNGYTVGWTSADETFTRRDAGLFINALAESLKNSSQQYVNDFARNLFYATGEPVFASDKLFAFIASFDYMRGYINNLSINSAAKQIVEGLSKLVTSTLYYPAFKNVSLMANTNDAMLIINNNQTIINNMWSALVESGYTATWDDVDEYYTRRDAETFLQSISWVVQTANEKPILDFVKGLFNYNGVPVFSSDKLLAFVFSFNNMRDQITVLPSLTNQSKEIVIALVTALTTTLKNTQTQLEPSTITAIGHTWTGIMAGVALTKIPPARNVTTIQESILELDQAVVIASGQDDQGSAIFVGGLEINADTGELGGPPFDQAVNRISTRAAIARSF